VKPEKDALSARSIREAARREELRQLRIVNAYDDAEHRHSRARASRDARRERNEARAREREREQEIECVVLPGSDWLMAFDDPGVYPR